MFIYSMPAHFTSCQIAVIVHNMGCQTMIIGIGTGGALVACALPSFQSPPPPSYKASVLPLAQGFGLVTPDPFSLLDLGGVWAQD